MTLLSYVHKFWHNYPTQLESDIPNTDNFSLFSYFLKKISIETPLHNINLKL